MLEENQLTIKIKITMETITEQKVIVNESQNMIRDSRRALDQDVKELNQIYEAIKGLNLPFEIAVETIFEFIKHEDQFVESFIRKSIVDVADDVSIGNLKMDREKLASQIAIPELSDLFNALKPFRQRFKSNNPSALPFGMKFFLLSDGKVIVNTPVLERWLDSNYRFYISESEREALNKAIETLDTLCGKYGGDSRFSIVAFGPRNNSCYLNEKFFRVSEKLIR